jgi:hypothetical protein
MLVTSQSVDAYDLTALSFPDVLPAMIPSVFYAQKYE